MIFRIIIVKMDLKTVGREDDDTAAEMNIDLGSSDYAALAAALLAGVGGAGNIASVDNCITRLRLEVKDRLLVDEKASRPPASPASSVPERPPCRSSTQGAVRG